MDSANERELAEISQNGNEAASMRKRLRAEHGVKCESLIKEATEAHGLAMRHITCAVFAAAKAGASLNALQEMHKRGQFTAIVEEYFCKPNKISIKTTQRYRKIAANFDLLIQALRHERDVSVEEVADEDLFDGVSINRALKLIRNPFGQPPEPECTTDVSLQRAPDPNNWITPQHLVPQILSLIGAVDTDPCAHPTIDALTAVRKFCKPCDGIAKESPWHGHVYINPGFEGIDHLPWVERALDEFKNKSITEALLLVPALTNTRWANATQCYPRAFFRTTIEVQIPGYIESKIIRTPAMLIFIANRERFCEFAKVFGNSLDVFLPT